MKTVQPGAPVHTSLTLRSQAQPSRQNSNSSNGNLHHDMAANETLEARKHAIQQQLASEPRAGQPLDPIEVPLYGSVQ